MKKEILNTLIGVTLGGVLLFFTLKDTDFGELYENLMASRPLYLILSLLILFFVFVFRALRWNVMLDNIDCKVKDTHILYYLLFGYLINTFTPKVGEVMRCTSLQKDTGIPVAKSLGSVVMERVYDVLILAIGLLVLGFTESERIGDILSLAWKETSQKVGENQSVLIGGVIGLCVLGLIAIFISRKLKLFEKIKSFVLDLLTSVKDSILMKNYPKFLLYTAIIWILLAVLNYVFIKSIPQTDGLTFYFAVVVLYVGALGWAMPTPNGMGSTHLIIKQLFIVFGLSEAAGVTFAVLSNGVILVGTILFGLIAVAIRYASKNWNPSPAH